MHFCDVSFSFGEKQILKTSCVKQHAFLVNPLGVSNDLSCAHTLMFFIAKKGGPNQERGSKFGSRVEISNPPDLLKGPIPTKKGAQKGAHSGFWATQEARGERPTP